MVNRSQVTPPKAFRQGLLQSPLRTGCFFLTKELRFKFLMDARFQGTSYNRTATQNLARFLR